MTAKRKTGPPRCSAEGCRELPAFRVMLYDFYGAAGGPTEAFFEQDFTCPYLCAAHALENEAKAEGERRPRGFVKYPYSNRHGAQGFTIYLELDDARCGL